MAKSFKLRLTRLIYIAFQSCRSKDPTTLPHDPLPSAYICSSSVNPKYVAVDHFFSTTKLSPEHQHHCSSAIKPQGSFSLSGESFDGEDNGRCSHEFKWKEEDKWHVVSKVFEESQKPRRKIYNSSASGESGEEEISETPRLSLNVPVTSERRIRRGKAKKVKIPMRHHPRVSTSSAESGLFSNDEEESETIVSTSRSFSTDSSSEYIPQLETIREKPLTSRRKGKKRFKRKQSKRAVSTTIYRPSSVSESESPARLSVFQKLITCSVNGKVKESFVVVKKSDDPYEDFKRSMMEMILEKQMFEESDLEQLLQLFLSLNSRDHHGLIVQVFVEIWEAMFSATDRSFDHRSSHADSITSGIQV